MKAVFDKLRQLSGGRLSQSQVDAGNIIADKAGKELLERLLGVADDSLGFELSSKGFELIAEFEGFRSTPYRDAVGVPTIGFGNTYYLDGTKVKMTDKPLSRDEAKQLKLSIINKDFAPAVRRLTFGMNLTQNQFDALVSLAYNIGTGALAKSSVIRYLKVGNKQAAADAFLMWDKAGGKTLKGLTRRRRAERALFLS